MRKDIIPYYKALGLAPGAEPLEIRRAYRQMIQQWHPDLYKPGSPMQTTAEDITKEINEAYDQLYRKKLYRNFPRKKETHAEDSQEPKEDEPVEAEDVPRRAKARAPGRPRAKSAKSAPESWARLKQARLWRHSGAIAVVLLFVAAGALGWRLLDTLSWPSAQPHASLPVQAHPSSPAAQAALVPTGAELGHAAAAATRTPQSLGQTLPAAHGSPSDAPALIDKAAALLDVYEVGDSKARVREIQGPPDESGETIFRYGSSVVYFRNGLVSSWIDRQPRLHVRDWASWVMPSLDPFSKGSSRADVVRAQGMPAAFTDSSYVYGSSVVYFDSGQVAGWSEGDVPLQHLDMPRLSFVDLDRLVDEQLLLLEAMPH